MQGYKTDLVNLIADNLRDRYDNGFPILKELIQNADDAKARRLIFGQHRGFPGSRQPLLHGPGLWFFNDGEFTERDAVDLRSFGIGGKAGDADAIGKFGLGMKSVFHLCEALFYVAWDGKRFHCEGLTPWKQEGTSLHQDWDETSHNDWGRLKDLGRELAPDEKERCTWFLLWLPLRMKGHLRTPRGETTGAIIPRFPGDKPAELAFLSEEKVAHDLAEMLPLLRHLQHVEHKGVPRFVLRLLLDAPSMMRDPRSLRTGSVQVLWADEPRRLAFSIGRIESPDSAGTFAELKDRGEWPHTRYRDELGQERDKKDKASPEGAVLLCSRFPSETSSRLHWAVFLPVEDGSEGLGRQSMKHGHSLILHGQFFLDAGRKRIHDHDHLHREPDFPMDAAVDESRLRRTWNQHLAQKVVLPLVLPTLEDHVQHGLPESECRDLTEAMSKSEWFATFRKHICRDHVWLRTLSPEARAKWALVDRHTRPRLRPLPTPPVSAAGRPWTVFPDLAGCGVLPYDVNAPRLVDAVDSPGVWSESELVRLLSRLDGLFMDTPSMDYLIDFLDTCAGAEVNGDRAQRGFLGSLREGLRAAGREERSRVAAKATRLIGFLQPVRRLALVADLPESTLKDLWGIDAPVLLVPKGFEPASAGQASPDETVLAAWLGVLDGALDSPNVVGVHQPTLQAVQGLLQTLAAENRARFLNEHRTLRVIGARDARSGVEKPVSVEYLERVKGAGCLFTYAEGQREATRMGVAPLLARAMPDADVCLVRAPTYRDLLATDEAESGLPVASDGQACLAAVGRYNGRLGDVADRRGLLDRASDPGTDSDARRGLRFLLHGSPDHRDDDEPKLWIGRHGQHRAWARLWSVMHGGVGWSRVVEELADAIPRIRWTDADIAEIDARTLIDELRETRRDINEPKVFSVEERDEILSRISDEDLWLHLPLHTALDGTPVSANHEGVYLAPSTVDQAHPLTGEATLIGPSQHDRVAEQQRRWLSPFDDRARIEVALAVAEPVRYWRDILDALDGQPSATSDEMQPLLRSNAWLPTTARLPVNPEDVIDLPESLSDEAHRLVAKHRAANGQCFAVPSDIAASVRGHGAWPELRRVGFSSGADGLERLGLLLEDLPDYRVGEWTKQPRAEAIELLAHCDELPGCRLLAMAGAAPFDSEIAWKQLGPTLSRDLDTERLVTVLGWLSQDNEQWELRKSAHDDYLRQLMAHRQIANEHLPCLRLASRGCRWREATELCVGAHGVVPASLLDVDQAAILGDVVCGAEQSARGESAGCIVAGFQHARSSAGRVLRDYFLSWDSSLVPTPVIGVLLALLGRDLRQLASEYLQPHSFEWLVETLPWRDPGSTQDGVPKWMGGKTAQQALDLICAGVQVVEEDRVDVHNLLGEPIQVALEVNPDTLLAGPLGGENYEAVIRLRRIELSGFRADALADLLRGTVEQVYSVLYNQSSADLSSLWQELTKSDQLEIGVARRLILDHLPFYLRQLSVRSDGIARRLGTCDELRRRIAEVEGHGQSIESDRARLRQEVDELASFIDESRIDRQSVLQAVKSRLEQYQYESSGIPLELFQNADDAVVELGQCPTQSAGGGDGPSTRHFVAEERLAGLRFVHWGRPINARGPVGLDVERRGYDRDLEKMLILSATDKLGGEGLTGKFGLGFKSVLLACDEPSILSGRLAVRVVAGILPQPWEDAAEARRWLDALGPDNQSGTLVDLPIVDGAIRTRVMERFRQLAGVLCVFGRAIRSIRQVGEFKSSCSWEPKLVCSGVEVGELGLEGDWGNRTKAVCVRANDGSLLMALGSRGFRALPDFVPALWVTAPTREATAVGFAINGGFDLDAGRGRLAGDTRNLDKARRIGEQAGEALGVLLERSHDDWPSVRAALDLAVDLDALGFWESVWFGLTKGWLKHAQDEGKGLVGKAALGALSRLAQRRCGIPNGLTGRLRGFSDLEAIDYELTGVLLWEDVSSVLGGWGRFTSLYARRCCSDEIGHILRVAGLRRPQSIGLSALPELLRSKVDPRDAKVLGRLWCLTNGEDEWQRDDLRTRLNGLQFRSQAGAWTAARNLLAAHGPLAFDEPRRHALAPPEFRLHADYYADGDDDRPAVAFFLACRQRMEASADTLAQWVLEAASAEEQSAAMEYLAEGELGEQVAERVRGQSWLPSAINSDLTSGMSDEHRDRLCRRLVSRERIERASIDTYEPEPPSPDDDDATAAAFFDRLADWWSADGTRKKVLGKHEQDCWPRWVRERGLADGLRQDSDDHWLALLVLGTCQSLGRTKDAQHRDFLERAHDKGWWEVFLRPDDDRAWMNVLRSSQDPAIDRLEYRLWLSLFPTIYQLSRHLDAYRALITSAAQRPEQLYSAKRLLTPRADGSLSGSGSQFDASPFPSEMGLHWCLRELVRLDILTADHLFADCYVPAGRVLDLLRPIGLIVEDNADAASKSRAIYNFLSGEDRPESVKAHFGLAFDIPLRYLAEHGNEDIRRQRGFVLGRHQARKGHWVRSKSELIIANLLFDRRIPYEYDSRLYAEDKSSYKNPDFTIECNGETWYWEHWGMMDDPEYRMDRARKIEWYKKHFDGLLEETFEKSLTADAEQIIRRRCGR